MTAAHTCLACGRADGQLVLDLGVQPLANNLLTAEDIASSEPRFPLRVFVCPGCWLLQIADLVPPVKLFSEYLYFSSFSDELMRHAKEAADRYCEDYRLGPGSFVVEIASNDGYLLQHIVQANVPCVGIEPAANVARAARDKGIETWTEFFGPDVARRLVQARGPADLVLANNVLAHVPEVHDFIDGLRVLLAPGGRAVIECPYATELIAKTEFDTIYHEHVFYFTLTPLIELFSRHGLAVWNVERIAIHGGSLRVFVGHHGAHPVAPAVGALLAEEQVAGVATMSYYAGFARAVEELRYSLTSMLADLKRQGRRIAAYGASAKGSTLLNYCALGAETLEFVVDRSPHKQGRFTPGSHLPIVAPAELLERMPDVTLLLTWNFADEILAQQRAYRERGGRFLIPIPSPAIR